MGYGNFQSKIFTTCASRPGMHPTVVGRFHPRVGWRGLYQTLSLKTSFAKLLVIDLKLGGKMKNQIEILKELFREVVGTISVEEFSSNRKLAELTTNLLNELSVKA